MEVRRIEGWKKWDQMERGIHNSVKPHLCRVEEEDGKRECTKCVCEGEQLILTNDSTGRLKLKDKYKGLKLICLKKKEVK